MSELWSAWALTAVPAARIEVDWVLDQTSGDQQVTTLADSRTLGPARYAADIRRSVETYLQHFGDVPGAAAELQVHANTLRYWIRRAEDILDINLAEPAGRLLVELQLAVRRRSMMINEAE